MTTKPKIKYYKTRIFFAILCISYNIFYIIYSIYISNYINALYLLLFHALFFFGFYFYFKHKDLLNSYDKLLTMAKKLDIENQMLYNTTIKNKIKESLKNVQNQSLDEEDDNSFF